MKVAVIGMGKMGKAIVRRVAQESMNLVAAVDAPKSPLAGKDAGLVSGAESLGTVISGSDRLAETLKQSKPDVVIDFSSADGCLANTKVVAKAGINMVIGTTGFKPEQERELLDAIKKGGIGAVLSPNMSVGVNIFWELAKEAARRLKGYDIEIIEAHHRFKKDAPSGTALKTAQLIAEEQGKNPDDVIVYGRKGLSPRREGEIAIHAIRAGDIVGEHTVIFSTLGERVELTHRAHSRDAFVEGVIRSARFVQKKKGVYSMKDVLD
ncbi:MAG: 4-hydroxy-tetrahydrodipicolinate reductase [Candidatus Altiarchaeota archaeon]